MIKRCCFNCFLAELWDSGRRRKRETEFGKNQGVSVVERGVRSRMEQNVNLGLDLIRETLSNR